MKHLIYTLLVCIPLSVLPQDGWEEQNSGITSNINSVFFFSASTGFAAGNDGKLIQTTDGGANWTAGSVVSSSNFQKIFFRNSTEGYLLAQDGTLFTSSNAGGAWSSEALNEHGLNSIDFSGNNGVIVGDDGNIFTTSDGNNWTKQTSLGVFTVNDVVFFDDTTVIAVGAGGQLNKSTDKGVTWTNITTGSSNTLSAISKLNSTTVLIAGTNGAVLEYEPFTGQLTSVALGLSTAWLKDISCDERDVCHVVGTGSTVLIRNVGTWMVRNMDDAVNLNAVHFVTGTTGYVGGIAGVLYKHEAAGFPNSTLTLKSENITIYPVPADNSFTIEIPNGIEAQVMITSSLGLVVNSFMLSGTEVVDVSNLTPGIYFVKIALQGQTTLKKLLIK